MPVRIIEPAPSAPQGDRVGRVRIIDRAAPAEQGAGFADRVGGAFNAAVENVKREYKAPPKVGRAPNPVGALLNVAIAPVNAAFEAGIVEPAANVLDRIPFQGYAPPHPTVQGGRLAMAPAHAMTPEETHADNEKLVGNALAAIPAGRAVVGEGLAAARTARAAPVAAPAPPRGSFTSAPMAEGYDLHEFEYIAPNGERVTGVITPPKRPGGALEVDINGQGSWAGGKEGANRIGVAAIRDFAAQVKAAYPEASTIVGLRTTGARPAPGMAGVSVDRIGARPATTAPEIAPAPPPAAAAPRNRLAETVAAFDRAGVNPLLAASGGKGSAATTNAIAENPIAGARVRSRLQTSVGQAGDAAGTIAGRYGETRGPQITGENIQAGVTRFAGDKTAPTSFAAKAEAAYGDVFGKLDAAMAGKTQPGRSVAVADPDFPTQTVVGGSQISTPNTTTALGGIRGGAQSSSVADLIADPTLSKAAKALESANGAKDLSFGDLRRLRTWVRDAQSNPELRANIGQANLKQLEGALTRDIFANADALGSPELSRQLRRTDQMYAAGMNRIQKALQPFADARSGEGAYSRVVQAAGSTASADGQRLLSLKRSLSPEEWGDVAANTLSELGKPTAGAATPGETGFSISTFVTNYNKLSPRGKEVLFGSIGGGGRNASNLRAELDNLARVADQLKSIEKGANSSKTFVNGQAWVTMLGLLNPGTTGSVAAGLAGAAGVGEVLTNPKVVRWLSRLGQASASQNPSQLRGVVRQLQIAAQSNAALLPLSKQAPLLLEAPKVSTPAAANTAPSEDR